MQILPISLYNIIYIEKILKKLKKFLFYPLKTVDKESVIVYYMRAVFNMG